jgi:hypothetical protein
MKITLFAAILALSSYGFAQNETWVKQDRLLIPAETIHQVDTLQSKDGEFTAKVITLDRVDGAYDVAISFGSVLEQQTYLSVGYASTAGDYSLKKNKDGTYQLKMLLGTITGKDSDGEPTFGSKDVSLKLTVDSEARVVKLEE